MKKYLFLSNSTKPSKKEYESKEKIFTTNFCKPCLEVAKEMGFEVYWGINRKYATEIENDLNVKMFDAFTFRNIFNIKDNYKAYKNIMNLLKEGDFEVIHCNTPIGGLLGRICGKKAKINKVIYTAHGFHFYDGAPLIRNIIYKTAERVMAHWTDVIITINQDDFEAAKKFHLKEKGKVYHIDGVGIEIQKFQSNENNRKKIISEMKLTNDCILLISVGDLNRNKNNKIIINALKKVKNEKIHYLICGIG
ncbi:MAG: glycosyltransferase, partial [Eubacterium sp.]